MNMRSKKKTPRRVIPLARMMWLSGRGRSCRRIAKKDQQHRVFQPGDGHFNLGMAIFEAQKWLFSEE